MENQATSDFRKFYQLSLNSELNRIENSRIFLLFFLSVLFFSILFLWWFSFVNLFWILILFSLALSVLFVMFFNFRNGHLENTFKESLINRILSFETEQLNQDKLHFSQLCVTEPVDFEDCHLLKSVKSGIKTENLFNGSLYGATFEACEISYLLTETESDTKAHIKAWFYKLEVPFNAKGEAIILPKSLKKYFVKEIRYFIKKGVEKIVDENADSEFWKKFELYCSDSFQLKLWFTSDLQDALLEALQVGSKIAISQKNQQMSLLLFSENVSLPYSLFSSLKGFKISEKYRLAIENIFLPLRILLKS